MVERVKVTDPLLDYLQGLLEYTRVSANYIAGLSPRAGMAILHSAQAWALIHGREHVIPEDIQAVLQSVISHRLLYARETMGSEPEDIAATLIAQVPIP